MASGEPSDEAIAAAREALARPEVDAVVAQLPPALAAVVRDARAALESDDPRAALAGVARRHRNDPGLDPTAAGGVLAALLQGLMAGLPDLSSLAEAGEASVDEFERLAQDAQAVAEGATAGDDEALAAVEAVVARLASLDLRGVLGPVLEDVGALQRALADLPRHLAGRPEVAGARVAALAAQAEALAERVERSDVSELAATLEDAVGALEGVVGDGVGGAAVALLEGATHQRLGHEEAAREAWDRALSRAEVESNLDVAASAGLALQLSLLQIGRAAEAADIAERVAAVAEAVGDARKVLFSRFDQGLMCAEAGRVERGRAVVKAALEQARNRGEPDLVSRGVLVLGKVLEIGGNETGALKLYETLLRTEGGADDEVGQAAMGFVRCLPADAIADPRRRVALQIVRAHALQHDDARTFAQACLLLAETEEAMGDRVSAVRVLVEARDILLAAGGPAAADPMDRALGVFREAWGNADFEAALARVRR